MLAGPIENILNERTKKQGCLQTSGDHIQSFYRPFGVVKVAYGDCRNAAVIKNNFLLMDGQ